MYHTIEITSTLVVPTDVVLTQLTYVACWVALKVWLVGKMSSVICVMIPVQPADIFLSVMRILLPLPFPLPSGLLFSP